MKAVKTASKASSKKATPESSRLTRDDWLDAAFNAVVEGGFDNVRVLVIADTLGVTRGSFYWHFADHAALVSALVARWRDSELALSHSLRAESVADPAADLRRLLDTALNHAGKDFQIMRFELALRGLGRRDPQVAQSLVEVDRHRMKLFEQKFLRLTGDKQAAIELATLFYVAIVGSYQALSSPTSRPKAKDYFSAIIADYLIQRQIPKPSRSSSRGDEGLSRPD